MAGLTVVPSVGVGAGEHREESRVVLAKIPGLSGRVALITRRRIVRVPRNSLVLRIRFGLVVLVTGDALENLEVARDYVAI